MPDIGESLVDYNVISERGPSMICLDLTSSKTSLIAVCKTTSNPLLSISATSLEHGYLRIILGINRKRFHDWMILNLQHYDFQEFPKGKLFPEYIYALVL